MSRALRHAMVVALFASVAVVPLTGASAPAGGAPSEGTVGTAKLAVGASHACLLSATGTVRCWGLNSSGQLGNNSLTNAKVPVPVSGLFGITQVATGTFHSSALSVGGTVQCWGLNSSGQLGNGAVANASNVPVPVLGLTGVTAIAAGGRHTCALVVGGTVQCWGQNIYGQLGNKSLVSSTVPVAVSGLSGVTAIAAGTYHTCALLAGGTVKCWGYNSTGQLGNNSFANAKAPVSVSGLANVRAIAVGSRHSCALIEGGTVQCWGQNASGQLGNNSMANAKAPVPVSSLTRAIAITAGASHSCALVVGGSAVCWGLNTSGQLGAQLSTKPKPKTKPKAPPPLTTVPVAVGNLTGVTAIGAGAAYSCASVVGGTVQCWGLGSSGQLGNNSLVTAKAPVLVSGVTGSTAMTALASAQYHTCGLLENGTVECWGDNAEGQLGNDSVGGSALPVPVLGVTGAIAVDVGRHFSCALLVTGTVDCWGYNIFGELGQGNIGGQSNIALAVPGLTGITALGSGDHHTCALSVAGTVSCWGWNLHGELGTGEGYASGSPLAVSGLTGVTALTAEDFDSCALLIDSTMRCWGYNGYGELGNNTVFDSSTPVEVSNLIGVTAIAMKSDAAFACALLVDSTVQCWGFNGFGQLGHGNATSLSVTPGAVSGLSGATAITIGDFHASAVLADGTARCWGYNAYQQLGDGTRVDSGAPVLVTQATGISAMSASTDATCALLANGTYQCWG